MNRFALLAVLIVAIIIAWLAFFAGPVVEPPPPVKAPEVETPAPPTTPVAPIRPALARDATPPPPDAAPADTPDAAAEEGPFTVSLGRHRVLLVERDGRFLEVELTAVVDSPEARRVVSLRREKLVRMLFFLASKRSADAVEAPGAQDRFVADLLPRLQNAVPTAQIEGLQVDHWAVVFRELKTPDAEAPPP